MIEKIIFTLQVIQVDFFTAFGFVSFLYFFVSIFSKKQFFKKIDSESIHFISFIGIVYLIIWIIGIFVSLYTLNEENKVSLINRMFGRYWFGFWIQPLLWVLITQLLRFKTIRKNILLRLLFSVLLVLSIERMIIFYTSLHRDYLPSSWTMYNDSSIYPSNLFLELLMKISIFLVFVVVFAFSTKKIKEWKLAKTKSQ